MLAKNLSRKRVNNVLNVLSKLLRYALELEIVGKIPTIKTLKVAPQKFDFFTVEELERLIDAAKAEPEWQAAIVLAAEAGLRMGELLATDRHFPFRHVRNLRNGNTLLFVECPAQYICPPGRQTGECLADLRDMLLVNDQAERAS